MGARTSKLKLTREFKGLRKLQTSQALAAVFAAWHGRAGREQGQQYRTTLWCRRLHVGCRLYVCARRLRTALKNAKKQAFAHIVDTLPEGAPASQILPSTRPLLGPSNPKKRKTRPLPIVHEADGTPCRDPEALRDRWIDFFRTMECGSRLSDHQLRAQWISNLASFVHTDLVLQPPDIPTLVDLEGAYRRVRPGKAIGSDRVPPELCHAYPKQMARLTYTQLIKLVTHGQEDLSHKGGQLVAAWKGKGRKRVPVGLGLHHARASLRRAKRRSWSSALLFLDLREAFYRVIRPLAVGGALTDATLGQIAGRLGLDADAVRDLHQLLQTPAGTAAAGLPAHLQHALRALHTDTFFFMEGQKDKVRTAAGTRPGDPFADVVFGYMFARLLRDLHSQLEDLNILRAVSICHRTSS
eukprot:s1196_g15.t1